VDNALAAGGELLGITKGLMNLLRATSTAASEVLESSRGDAFRVNCCYGYISISADFAVVAGVVVVVWWCSSRNNSSVVKLRQG